MTFTFIHTADWQIGKSFGTISSEKAPLLRAARLSVIDRIAEVARANGAAHVLVAGDVYDSPSIPNRFIAQSLDRLQRHGDLAWHLLPGNHDPARSGGIWERLGRLGVPANVHLHLVPKPVLIAEGVALLPAPLAAASVDDDPTAWMNGADTPEGYLRIGLAHGSIQGFGSGDGDAKVPIDPTRWRSAGLSYLALGDWHGLTRIGDRVWYSGTPEPDRFPDNEPGYALVVRLNGEEALRVERKRTSQYQWIKQSLELTDTGGIEHFESTLAPSMVRPEHVLLRLAVSGTASLTCWSRAQERLTWLEERIFHFETVIEGLQIAPESVELEELGTGDLREAAEGLGAIARGLNGAEAATASLALRKLHQFWREARPGSGR